MYKKVSADLDFCAREQETLAFWRRNAIIQKTLQSREGAAHFTFYDGPPTANGKPHIGHLITRSIKDLFPRYKRMKGYNVLCKAGWDTHGLPVELEVEKLLGLDGKEQIEEYGVEPFIAECKQSVWKYKTEWEEMSERVGFWADMEHPYVTYDNNYIESVWWSLKKIADQGLLYKGHKIVPYCPRCGTALSSHEVAQGYKDVKENTVFVRFAAKEAPNTYLIAWTTTPWTLPSNVALCVNPKETYVHAKVEGDTYILAKALVENVLGEQAEILSECTGAELEGMEYEPLFDFQKDLVDKRAWFVVSDGYVTLTEGSGIVHIAPAFGEDDNRLGRNNDLPFLQLVDNKGCMDNRTLWGGKFVKDADADIIEELKKNGNLVRVVPHEHSYPFCWRCDTPLLYYARSSWFIKMTEVRDKLMANNKSVNWLPETIRDGRMGNFLENVIDWGLSRERYWGTPLPVWECGCGHREVIGSRQQIREMGGDLPEGADLHKPYIDRVQLTCPECGGKMKRVPEVIDCWYDSGSMPFAQFHYPFENKELFESNYPANFISEAVDQTRGWFYTLLAISTCLFDKPAFENCIVLGHVQDKDGQKMSKHKGNVVDPWSALNKQGADAVRWYFYTGSAPWLPSRFYDEAVSESQRKFMGTLWNTYAFYILYADIDGYNPFDPTLPKPELSVMDEWVLSKLHSLVAMVTENLDNYRVTEPARAISDFVDDLSNWYVRRGRDRYWASEMDGDKSAAYFTLFTVLETLARLSAPFVPFMAEEIYQNLVRSVNPNAPESVHLCDYPVADSAMIDKSLEEEMEIAREVVTLGRACRNVANIKNRQPIGLMMVQGDRKLSPRFEEIILGELNVKELRQIDDAENYIGYLVKPQLKTLGPRYGKLLPAISAHLRDNDGGEIVGAILNEGGYRTEINGQTVELQLEDLLIETTQKPGYVVQTEHGISVVLTTTLTPELIEEGYVREVVSKVQTMRKEAGFDVTDHIVLSYTAEGELQEAMKKHEAEIAAEVLADAVAPIEDGYQKEWDINGCKAVLAVKRIEG